MTPAFDWPIRDVDTRKVVHFLWFDCDPEDRCCVAITIEDGALIGAKSCSLHDGKGRP